jgi:hypothetical protein
MRSVHIADPYWEKLKRLALPLESAKKAVERLIDRAMAHQPPPEQLAVPADVPPPLPQHEYRQPIGDVLKQLGRRSDTKQIKPCLEKMMAPRLGPADYAICAARCERWWNNAQWERLQMVKDGLLRADSPPGVWELVD